MDVEKLISIIHETPPLWDMRDKRYHHRDVQKKLWEKVAEEMGEEASVIKKKWQGLRDVFRKEFNKSVNGRSGDEAPSEFSSSWLHFNNMMFLKDIIQHRKLQGNVSPINFSPSQTEEFQEEAIASNTENDSSACGSSLHSTYGNHQSIVSGSMDPPLNSDVIKKNTEPNKGTKRKRPDKLGEDPFLQIEREKLKLFAADAAAKEDSDYQFLILLPYLRNVPSNRKLTVRHKLQQVFLDEEKSALQQPSIYSSNVSPRPATGVSTYDETNQTDKELSSQRYKPLSPVSNYNNLPSQFQEYFSHFTGE